MRSVANRDSDSLVGWAPFEGRPPGVLTLGPAAMWALCCTHVCAEPDVHFASAAVRVNADTSDVFVTLRCCGSCGFKQYFHLLG